MDFEDYYRRFLNDDDTVTGNAVEQPVPQTETPASADYVDYYRRFLNDSNS